VRAQIPAGTLAKNDLKPTALFEEPLDAFIEDAPPARRADVARGRKGDRPPR
jgi:hypothetical protein